MSRRADVVDELSADHRAVAELLARIEKTAPDRTAGPPAAGPQSAAPHTAEPGSTGPQAPQPVPTAPDGVGAPPADAGRGDGVVALVEELSDLLLSHCTEEEEHLFPTVHDRVPDGGSLVFTSLADHLAIGQYLTDLQGQKPGDPAFGHLLEGLATAVHTHLAEEDERLFPAVRKAVPAELLVSLGEQLRAARQDGPAAAAEPPAPSATTEG
ncbi:hemerythrin domain-containing protein [Kitasatospora sp. NPDC057015]|uniref:hemerythrin domain-containing protein n=1 Tax=Kitasatospora sp. NPDC057015 TaxID=3346001 RepID=UPI00362A4D23